MSMEVTSSPSALNSGGKELTNKPIMIGIALVLLVLFAIFYAAQARSNNQAIQDEVKAEEDDANQITTNREPDFLVQELSTKKIEPNGDETGELDTNALLQPPPPMGSGAMHPNAYEDDIDREAQRKKELKNKALASASQLEVREKRTPKEQKDNKDGEAKVSIDELDPHTAMLALRTLDKNYLQKEKVKPLSRYELKAGWMIPATLITGINSDLAGEVLAQVNENIYDSATGKYLLIPQGAKLVGSYSSEIIYGQNRVLTAWNRLIYPNGDTLDLSGMNGADIAGMSGFEDQVNNHYFRIFGSAFLLSSITAGVAISDKSNSEVETNRDKAIGSAIDQMSTVASEMIRKNMNIAPTIEIRSGYKFNIFVNKDIILEPIGL